MKQFLCIAMILMLMGCDDALTSLQNQAPLPDLQNQPGVGTQDNSQSNAICVINKQNEQTGHCEEQCYPYEQAIRLTATCGICKNGEYLAYYDGQGFCAAQVRGYWTLFQMVDDEPINKGLVRLFQTDGYGLGTEMVIINSDILNDGQWEVRLFYHDTYQLDTRLREVADKEVFGGYITGWINNDITQIYLVDYRNGGFAEYYLVREKMFD